ncbi:MAG: S41 family peptidase [Anaerolineae bacterium]
MKKALVIVGAFVVLGALLVAAFAGGLVLGRATGRSVAPTTPTRDAVTVPSTTDTPAAPLEETTPSETAIPPDDEEPTPLPSPTPYVVEDEPQDNGAPAADTFDYELLRTVLEILDEQYYGEIPDGEELAYGAVRGMLMTLDDPYTSFIEPEIAAILNEDASGEYEGIGAWVRMREDGYLEISGTIPGQPAEAAGVRAGDIIVAVGDQSIVGMGLYEAISYIRGPAGSEAELHIIRPGVQEELTITVTRASIETPILETEMLENDIAYLRLTEFDANATDRVEEALEELLAEDPQGLVFDLRDNPGGWLNESIGVADLFLDEGLVAIQRDSSGREQRFGSDDGDIGEEIPMVVLVNAGSASASEIVAGALQDRGRAVLIGTQTLGKGSVQLPNNLENGAQLRVTIARWYTPNEQSLHGNGLTPDIEVTVPPETPAGEDPQLDRAIEYLREGVDGS